MARRISGFAGLVAAQLAATAAIGVAALTPASAQETSDLEVMASVKNVCNITSNGGLDFGDLVKGEASTATTALEILCTFNVSNATVDITNGQNFDSVRRLQIDTGGLYIPYELCGSSPNGDTCSEWMAHTGIIIVGGSIVSIDVHGLITSSTTDAITQHGDYEDTLEVELTF